ncbi:MAG: hypothetical protein JO060_00780 [Candidatus Eremiobacteraeota bacterium]|nr:hypothetical protein [Candidatus Eremiobacteraeota bacterium]MBV9646271.1 hypothetical protein [Candidatus Eremiobacteraeota bacterium]
MSDIPAGSLSSAVTATLPKVQPTAYDRLACFCASWFLVGLFADGWSHYHDVRESFFTPYHAVLYSGFFANVALVAYTMVVGRRAGKPWIETLPGGYALTALGVAWFTIGVAPDMLWHRIFGIEEGIDVLISPTHLFLGVGMALVLLGPARAALARRDPPTTLEEQLPAIVSLALFLAMIEFTLQFAFDSGVSTSDAPLDPSTGHRANLAFFLLPFTYYKEALGITIVVIHAALIAGFALFVVTRMRPAFGTFVVLYGLPAFLMAVLLSNGALSVYVSTVQALVFGLIVDALVLRLRPEPQRAAAIRVFAVLVPALSYVLYLSVAQWVLGGVWWDVNLVFGSIVFAGVAGLLLSLIAVRTAPTAAGL